MSHATPRTEAVYGSSAWASCIRPRDTATLRLVCFPFAGGGVQVYRQWAEKLHESIEVWALNLPGREQRISENPIASIRELCSKLSEGLSEVLYGNFSFFGHSMGALLSFELARLLRRQGHRGPRCLIVSGLGAPHLPSLRKSIGHLSDSEFIAELHNLNGTPPEVFQHPELLELLLPTLRADFLAVEKYDFIPDAPLSCPIFAYGGTSDVDTPAAHLAEWGSHTSGRFTTRLFPGDHFFVQSLNLQLTTSLTLDLLSDGDAFTH